jgi:hypothetical protein
MSVQPAEQASYRPTPPWKDRFEIRHIAVRILYAQPATGVSPWEFRVLAEVPTFQEVNGQEPGLWREISDLSCETPRIRRRVSAR